MRPLLPLIIFCLSTKSAFAGSESPFALSTTLRLVWGLLIVLGLLLAVYALAKKKLTFLQAGNGKSAITIIEMRHLMPRKSLCLIKVRGQEYLLGLGNEQINLIAAIEPEQPSSTDTPETASFAATLATAASDKT